MAQAVARRGAVAVVGCAEVRTAMVGTQARERAVQAVARRGAVTAKERALRGWVRGDVLAGGHVEVEGAAETEMVAPEAWEGAEGMLGGVVAEETGAHRAVEAGWQHVS